MIKQLAVAFEISGGAPLSKEALNTIIICLEKYSETEITVALERCAFEVRGRLYVADIIQRIPRDPRARPGADEAFAMLPFSESQSVVWTREMAEAFAVIRELHDSDPIGARMAFRETYNRLCSESIARREPVDWQVSLGTYKAGRESAIKEAYEKGRLTKTQVRGNFPELLQPAQTQLPPAVGDDKNQRQEGDIQIYIANLKKSMGVNFKRR